MDEQLNELAPELMQAIQDQVDTALAFVDQLFIDEKYNKILAAYEHESDNLTRLELFLQVVYYGNMLRGDNQAALLGLHAGVRAAFMYGILLERQKLVKSKLTPVLSTLKEGIVQ